MAKHVLITGGAGFIGSHLTDALLARGHHVRVLDSLSPQVHGHGAQRPAYLAAGAELVVGDMRDVAAVRRALAGIDVVYHLAALLGVGRSTAQLGDYTSVNGLGTVVLLEALIRKPVERLIVTSSMNIYGEGMYMDAAGRLRTGHERSADQLRRGRWEVHDELGAPLKPVPTSELKSPALASVYALSKYEQERLCLLVGRTYGIPTIALRLFNVYGPRQSPANRYAAVLSAFASRLLNERAPLVYEDGLQQRDFVSVYDVAQACVRALDAEQAAGHVLNVGSGTAHTVLDVAARVARVLHRDYIEAEVTGKYRVGDIRHCYADITRARLLLGYEPRVSLDYGLLDFAAWLDAQPLVVSVNGARRAPAARSLTIGR